MKYLELSTEELNIRCKDWAKCISLVFRPDLIIYIARAGYIFAKPMAEIFDVPLLGIGAVRSGNSIKEIVGPIFAYLPSFFRKIIAKVEIKSGVHKKKTEREVVFHQKINDINCSKYRKILIVDDAVDTGYSMKKVAEMAKEKFNNADIRTACFNMSCDEKDCVMKIDYIQLQGYSVKTPFSKDSKEYTKTKKQYYKDTNNEYI